MAFFPILDRHIEEVVNAALEDDEDILAAEQRRRKDIWGDGCTKTGRGIRTVEPGSVFYGPFRHS